MPPSESCETRKARTHRYHLFTDAAAPETAVQTARNSKGAAPKLLDCVLSLHPELNHEHQGKIYLPNPSNPSTSRAVSFTPLAQFREWTGFSIVVLETMCSNFSHDDDEDGFVATQCCGPSV